MNPNSLSSKRRWLLAVRVLLVVALLTTAAPHVASANGINLVINGQRIVADPAPFAINGRTLAPLRLIAEKLEATVDWYGDTQTIKITRGDRQVMMRLDNRLVDLAAGQVTISDVPPRAYDSRTFIPLRLFATALGVSVTWDQATSSVIVDSRVPVSGAPPKVVAITSVQSGQVISVLTAMQLSVLGSLPAGAAEVRYQLLDPATGRGPVVGRGTNLTAAYTLLPDPFYSGPRVLAAGVYDQKGGFLAGDAVPVVVSPAVQVALTGVTPGQALTGAVSLGSTVNFQATSVKYEAVDPATDAGIELGKGDPQGQVTWVPQMADNGSRMIRVTAYDRLGKAYVSQPVPVTVGVERKLALTGVKADGTVDKPVTLGISANFSYNLLQYILRDPATGNQEVLYQHDGWATYRWFPGPAQAGRREVLLTVTDAQGNTFETAPVAVEVNGDPKISLQTIGPNQVLNGQVSLKALANMPLAGIEYDLVNSQTGTFRVLAGGPDALSEYVWTPVKADDGNWQVRVMGVLIGGARIYSPAVPVRVFSGTLYGPKPIIEKSKFQEYASGLAVKTMQKTGMSAALQVAQAILETGWGQSSPVDKYSGKVSYNLFGIKGSGPAGSVTSNTWEEYNGISYRIDDSFRAYGNVTESWDDHAQLLLTKSWYGPFRAVMYDSTQGALALRRCGYATDSQYPAKLMDIINRYGLYELDEVGI
ncbi:MAG TPA: stalk domain-containing protein [Bacillota bacterium]|jgi:hypothetical protein